MATHVSTSNECRQHTRKKSLHSIGKWFSLYLQSIDGYLAADQGGSRDFSGLQGIYIEYWKKNKENLLISKSVIGFIEFEQLSLAATVLLLLHDTGFVSIAAIVHLLLLWRLICCCFQLLYMLSPRIVVVVVLGGFLLFFWIIL